MKMRYKPWAIDEVVEFDPGTELICPGCGTTKPVPFGFKTHQTIVLCAGSATTHGHSIAMFDVNSLLGDFETEEDDRNLMAYLVREGNLFEEDIKKWLELKTMWYIMYLGGTAPKWKVEPEPLWRRRISQETV